MPVNNAPLVHRSRGCVEKRWCAQYTSTMHRPVTERSLLQAPQLIPQNKSSESRSRTISWLDQSDVNDYSRFQTPDVSQWFRFFPSVENYNDFELYGWCRVLQALSVLFWTIHDLSFHILWIIYAYVQMKVVDSGMMADKLDFRVIVRLNVPLWVVNIIVLMAC